MFFLKCFKGPKSPQKVMAMFGVWVGVFFWESGIYAQNVEEETPGILFSDEDPEESKESPPAKNDLAKTPSGQTATKDPGAFGPPKPTPKTPQSPSLSSPSQGESSKTSSATSIKRSRFAPRPDIFGEYRVRLGASKPTFTKDLLFYDSLYGATSFYPSLSADWFAFDWYATFGLSLRTGFYSDEGKALKGNFQKESPAGSDLQKDLEAPTTLTLFPLQVCAMFEFTPFDQKWLVLDGWFGIERLYYQEVRAGSSEGKAMVSTSSTPTDTVLTNNGFKNGVVYGFGANIRIDALDQRTALSVRPMGLDAIFLAPSYEVVQQSDKGADFSRTVTSLAFVFETRL